MDALRSDRQRSSTAERHHTATGALHQPPLNQESRVTSNGFVTGDRTSSGRKCEMFADAETPRDVRRRGGLT